MLKYNGDTYELQSLYLYALISITAENFIGRVTQFFANNSLTEYRITIEFLHNFFINASIKDFTPIYTFWDF